MLRLAGYSVLIWPDVPGATLRAGPANDVVGNLCDRRACINRRAAGLKIEIVKVGIDQERVRIFQVRRRCNPGGGLERPFYNPCVDKVFSDGNAGKCGIGIEVNEYPGGVGAVKNVVLNSGIIDSGSGQNDLAVIVGVWKSEDVVGYQEVR